MRYQSEFQFFGFMCILLGLALLWSWTIRSENEEGYEAFLHKAKYRVGDLVIRRFDNARGIIKTGRCTEVQCYYSTQFSTDMDTGRPIIVEIAEYEVVGLTKIVRK